jgi:hypothetical protein
VTASVIRTLAPTPGRMRRVTAHGLASDDLRHPLMAHAHELGNGRHRESRAIGRPNGRIPLVPQGFSGLLQRCFALGVVLSEGSQPGSRLRGLTFSSGDPRIV